MKIFLAVFLQVVFKHFEYNTHCNVQQTVTTAVCCHNCVATIPAARNQPNSNAKDCSAAGETGRFGR